MPTRRTVIMSVQQYDVELKNDSVTWTQILDVAQRVGVAGIEFREVYWRDKTAEIPAIRAELAKRGLIATYATFETLFGDNASKRVREAIDDAAALGSRLLRVFAGPAASDDDRPAWDDVASVIDYAAGHGVVVALENFARTPGNRVADVQGVLGHISGSNLGTNLDIGNYAANDQDVLNAIRSLGPRIVSSHLKDVLDTPGGSTTTALGEGRLPIAAIMTEFDRLPQPIIHCFEFAGGGESEARVQRSLAMLAAL
ncbi:MAG TPA: sugar phosphate isomerase/epimerase family protein [Chloroflexota bacterium]|nr:sugar phosphate isomerase/epimerase family protein [Chloroflexota bacterium]